MPAAAPITLRPSLYGAIPEQPKEDLLRDYLSFLKRRNGSVDTSGPFPERERWLQETEAGPARYEGRPLSAETFNRLYAAFDPKVELTPQHTALLAFVKMNAGEAYGVEVVSKMRHRGRPTHGVFDEVERVLGNEETYHTRILASAAVHFGLEKPKSAWRPPPGIKILIGALAYSPKSIFHPILLGAEVSGVFTFNWMLRRVGEVFRDAPLLREAMEARLIEILIDEVGHVAFNRLAVGPWGLGVARRLAPHVSEGTARWMPEFTRLGWSRDTLRALERFDLPDLPAEVLRRSFFV